MTGTQNGAQEIAALYETILARKTADPTDSYSAQLLADLPRAARKLGEEASETMVAALSGTCLLYTSPSPRDVRSSRMPSSA